MSNILAEAIVKLGADLGDLEAGLALAEEEMLKVSKTFESIGKSMSKFITLPLLAIGGVAVHEFGEAADEMAKLQGVITSTGGVAGVSAEHIDKLALALQNTTRFSDETTKSAAAVLLTFQDVRNEVGHGNDVFDRAIKASQGLAAIMGGDLNGAIRRLGLALEDPEAGLTLLRRTGVSFTDQEQEQIKTLQAHGQVLEAQRLILDKVEGKFKAVAEAMAKTPTGQLVQAWNQVKEALEGVGAILAPLVITFAKAVKTIAVEFQKLPKEFKVVLVAVASIAAAAGPLIVAFAKLRVAWVGVQTALALAGTTFAVVFAWVTLIALALVGLIAIGVQLAQNWTTVKLKLESAWLSLKKTAISLGFAISFAFLDTLAAVLELLSHIPLVGKFFADAAANIRGEQKKLVTDTVTSLSEIAKAQAANTAALEADLLSAGDLAEGAGVKIQHGLRPPPPPIWAKDAAKAMKDLQGELAAAEEMAKLLGPSFDLAGARADAYKKVVEALVAAHVPLDTVLDRAGHTLRSLSGDFQQWTDTATTITAIQEAVTGLSNDLETNRENAILLGASYDSAKGEADAYGGAIDKLTHAHVALSTVIPGLNVTLQQLQVEQVKAQKRSDETADAQQHLSDQYQLAAQAVQAALTPLQIYQQTMQALAIALANGKIVQEQFDAAVKQAKETLTDATKASDQLRQGLVDMTTRAIDSFIDMAFQGKQSFSEFVVSALQDIAKLIIKLELLKLLFGPGGPLASLTGGKIPGLAAGGFVKAGGFALVGESGPELVQAGRAGVSVAPLTAQQTGTGAGAASPAGGDHVGVTVQIVAPDTQSAARFFEENEGLVAKAIFKAFNRSKALRSRLTGAI